MATLALLGTASFDTNSGTHTVTATPAVNDVIILTTAMTGSSATTAPTDNQSGTYTQITFAVKNASADRMAIWIRDTAVSAAVSTVYTHAPGATTGGGLGVIACTGMSVWGSSAIRQSAKADNQAALTTPTVTMGAACLAGNPIIEAVFNALNLSTVATPTGYSTPINAGWNTPTSGFKVATRNSGETNTSLAWGNAPNSAYCCLAIELAATTSNAQGNMMLVFD